jgi:hypothetical protein
VRPHPVSVGTPPCFTVLARDLRMHPCLVPRFNFVIVRTKMRRARIGGHGDQQLTGGVDGEMHLACLSEEGRGR